MHAIAPFLEREERDRIVHMRYPPIPAAALSQRVRGYSQPLVDVLIERLVADARLSERGDVRVPSTGLELQRCDGCDGAPKGVADQGELVIGVGEN